MSRPWSWSLRVSDWPIGKTSYDLTADQAVRAVRGLGDGGGQVTAGKTCCGLPMSTLEVFGVRLYRCMHRGHHALVFRNLGTGEEIAESYRDGDGGLEWTSHYGEGDGE